jgi:catechol 2,3-dioxygenase-like lactoylglutathione lyase family enzyme
MDCNVVDIDHVAIRVNDIDAAIEFYGDLLGMAIKDLERFERGEVPFPSAVAGAKRIHLYPSDEPIDIDREHVCLVLRPDGTDPYEYVDELIAYLDSWDIPVESTEPLERTGAYGVGWATYASDPDGRRVELKAY